MVSFPRLLALALLLTACSPATATAPIPTASPRQGGVAVLGDWERPLAGFAAEPLNEPDLRLQALVLAPLWDLDAKGRPVARLVTQVPTEADHLVTRSAAGLVVDVRLRPGLRWSDGTPLDAGAVVRAAEASGEQIERADRRSDLEVALTLKPWVTTYLQLGPRVRPLPPSGGGLPPGSGPFRAVPSGPGSFRFERNPYYAGPPAHLDAVVYRTFPSHDALLEALQAGSVDAGFHLGPSDVDALKGIAGSAPLVTTTSRMVLLNPNHESGPWAGSPLDQRLIDALSRSLDRDTLAAGNLPTSASVPAAKPAPPLHDVQAATAELDEDGWKAGADGTRAKDGKPLAFAIEAACEDSWSGAVLDAVKRDWAALGAKVETTCLPRNRLLADGAAGKFQMQLYSIDLGWDPKAWDVLWRPGPENWNRCQDSLGCTIPLYQERSVIALSERLRGFDPGRSPEPETWNAAGWWLAG